MLPDFVEQGRTVGPRVWDSIWALEPRCLEWWGYRHKNTRTHRPET